MANNPYVNKVVYGATTIIDISDTTATADKILQGYGCYGADGAWIDGTAVAGSGSAVSIVDTTDENGGTIRTITGVSLAGDTVTAATLLNGVTAHNSLGEAITGSYVPPTGAVIEANKTVSPTESQQIVTPSTGYDALAQVTVNAISSSYVGSGIDRRSSSDLTASGATVSVPAGYYSSAASKAVSSGTAGTPTATKGTVSNHSVSVTPSVTNTTGYITGSTKTGTAVTVSASELVSGSETKTANGTYDVTNLAELVVNVSGGSSKNAQVVQATTRTNSSSLTAIGAELTVSKTGTYDIYYSCFRTNTSSSYTWGTRLYIDGTAHGSENTTWTNNQQNTHLTNVSLTSGQKLRVYGRETRGTSYYVCAPMLAIVEV